jgi:rhomboid protease GluP
MDPFALFHSPYRQKCEEFNLVFQAMGIESEIVEYENRHYLLVDEQVAEYAYGQLKSYVIENAPEEIIRKPLIPFAQGYIAAFAYALVLLLFAVLQWTNAFDWNWQQQGVADSWKIIEGEWWRAITALFLHADFGHLASNIGFGALFGLLVSQHIGRVSAWLTILLAGATGNLVNAYWYASLHQSIGASTMVYAALGLLGVFALKASPVYGQRAARRWLPFSAAIALLAFTGTGGERTDVLAHLSGFASGCVSGLVWVYLDKPIIAKDCLNKAIAALTLFIIALAWFLALVVG